MEILRESITVDGYKLSVSGFLNTDLKCVVLNGKEMTYPMYFRIIYKRKTTNFRSLSMPDQYTFEFVKTKRAKLLKEIKRIQLITHFLIG